MNFEDRARNAGRHAQQVGEGAPRPSLASVSRKRIRRVVLIFAVVIVGFLGLVVLLPIDGSEGVVAVSPTSTSTSTTAVFECSTSSPVSDFTPPPDHPPVPPDLYDSVWHGSDELWTMISNAGAVWDGLPQNTPGLYTQKVFWWSDGYDAFNDPATLEVSAVEIETAQEFVFAGSDVTSGFRPDIGHFMISGVELPPGCWQLTGHYEGTSTSIVVEIVGA